MMNRSLDQGDRTGIEPILTSVVRETIALQNKGSASYFTEKIITRTAVGIADCRTQTSSCSYFIDMQDSPLYSRLP